MVNNTDVKIIKETKKALLLEKEGIKFWVQRRWYRQQIGHLTPAGIKSFELAKVNTADYDRFKREMEGYKVWIKEEPYYFQGAMISGYGRVYYKDKFAHIGFTLYKGMNRHRFCKGEREYTAYINNSTMEFDDFEKAIDKFRHYLCYKRWGEIVQIWDSCGNSRAGWDPYWDEPDEDIEETKALENKKK